MREYIRLECVLWHEYKGLSEQSTIGPCKAGMHTTANRSHEELLGATQQNRVQNYLIFEDHTGTTYVVIQ